MDKSNVGNTIHKLIEKMKRLDNDNSIQESCPISIISMEQWEWPQGVALFAMYHYYKETKDQQMLEYLLNWYHMQFEKELPPKNVNTMCPMLTLSYLYEETNDETYFPYLKEWSDYIMKEMPRTKENGIQHIVSGQENKGQLWDDTLYMTVLFLARMGHILKDDSYIQESIRQFLVHIKYLTDCSTGLFYHGWTFEGNHNFAKALWGRGNSWYTAGLVDYLEMMEGNLGVREFLLTTLEAQVEKLAELQDESGLWHTILDDTSSYLETSASCAFAYGILKAVRNGYLNPKYEVTGIKALKGIMNKIDEQGSVQDVSYGTPVFHDIEDYKKVILCPMPYGQSMALLLLVEAQKHEL